MKDDFRQIQPNLLDISNELSAYAAGAKPGGFFAFGDRPESVPETRGSIELYRHEPVAHPGITDSIDWLKKALAPLPEISPPIKFGEDPGARPATPVGSRPYGSAALDVVYYFAHDYEWSGPGPYIHVLFTDSVPRVRGSSKTVYDSQPIDMDDVLSNQASYLDLRAARTKINSMPEDRLKKIITVVVTQVDQDGGNVNPSWEQLMGDIGLKRYSTGFINVENTLFVKQAVDKALNEAICEYIDDFDPIKTTTTTTTTTSTTTATSTSSTSATTMTTTSPSTMTTTSAGEPSTSSSTEMVSTSTAMTTTESPSASTTTRESPSSSTEIKTTTTAAPKTTSTAATTTSSSKDRDNTVVIIGAAGGGLAAVAALGYYLYNATTSSGVEDPGMNSPPNPSQQGDRATLIHVETF